MQRCSVTKTWPMRYVGVWCIFGSWTFHYQTLKEALNDPEIETICIYTNTVVLKDSPTLSEDWGIRHSFCIDENWTIESIADKVLDSLQYRPPFLAAVAFNESDLALANQLNRILGTGDMSAYAIRTLISKHMLYTALQAASLPMVTFHTWTTDAELEALVEQDIYRQGLYVLKPVESSDSAGVYRSLPEENVKATLHNYHAFCQESCRIGLTSLHEQPSLVMEYIDYDGIPIELTADGIVENGQVVFQVIHEKTQVREFAPFFDERMVAPPVSPRIRDRLPQINATTQKVADTLKLLNCVFHFEYRLTATHCIPIDCALRPGGGFIPHAIYMLSGIDLILAHIETHLAAHRTRIYPTELAGGTCIGALYASLSIGTTQFAQLIKTLNRQEFVFAIYHKQAPPVNPMFTVDAGLSLGIHANTPEEACTHFERSIQDGYKVIPSHHETSC